MQHTYEEIRHVTLDILAGKVTTPHGRGQFDQIQRGVAQILRQRIESVGGHWDSSSGDGLNRADADAFLEVFWNLFRDGVITLGNTEAGQKNFPWCQVSALGKKVLETKGTYFFLDVSSFEKVIRGAVPSVDDVTMIYLKEAMQAFLTGCILSSSVMLGVASEHTFNLLLKTAVDNPKHEKTFKPIEKEQHALRRLNRFKKTLDDKLGGILPQEIREDLDTHFVSISAVIRTFRNESGHPSGNIIGREQAYVLLNLFPSYCKKAYQLRDWLAL
jgi:hypothetical protein